jgi:4-diphosphocytidyl-2-C-methyl-D-erythritol kinase
MICFPNAKINLGLNVVERRTDGFHNIETIMYPIPLYDVLEFKEANNFSIDMYGNTEKATFGKNTIEKVWEILNERFSLPTFKVILLKNIPTSAGMGGGSSDAAFFLKEVNKNYNLKLSINEMEELIANVGSDCPFFIKNETAIASSRGEVLNKLNINLEGNFLSLIKPLWGISTQQAFEQITPKVATNNLKDIILQPLENWSQLLKNDFEDSLIPRFPEIKNIKDFLFNQGAEYASLSGSGSSVFAISKHKIDISKYKGKAFKWQHQL